MPKVKFDDIVETLKQNKQKGEQAESRVKDLESLVNSNDLVQAAIIGSIQVLIEFFAQETTKTEVTNLPEPVTSVSTPDISKVVDAVRTLNDTVVGKTVDLNPHLEVLKAIQTVLQGLPTDYPKFPDFPSSFEVSNLSDALKALDEIQKAIKKQKLDPKITVKPADVNLDLKPLEKLLKELIKKETPAFPEIVIPENDYSELMTAVMGVTDAINSLHFPVSNYRGENIVNKLPLKPGTDYDYMGIAATDSDTDTLTLKTGGSGGTTVQTLTINYTSANASKISDTFSELSWI